MNKNEFIEAVAQKMDAPKSQAQDSVNAFLQTVEQQLSKGQKISFVGFGTFETTKRAAREGRNPQTGATIKIQASNQPKFKPGKALKEACN